MCMSWPTLVASKPSLYPSELSEAMSKIPSLYVVAPKTYTHCRQTRLQRKCVHARRANGYFTDTSAEGWKSDGLLVH